MNQSWIQVERYECTVCWKLLVDTVKAELQSLPEIAFVNHVEISTESAGRHIWLSAQREREGDKDRVRACIKGLPMHGMFTLSNCATRQLGWLHHQLFKYANLLMQSSWVCARCRFFFLGTLRRLCLRFTLHLSFYPECLPERESAPSVPSPAEVCRTGSQRRQLENVFIIILFGCA